MRSVLFLVTIVVAIGVASHFAFQLDRAGQVSAFVCMLIPTVAIAALGLYRAWDEGTLRDWLAVRAGDFTRGFLAAVVLFGMAWAGAKIVAPMGTARESWLARLYLQRGDPGMVRQHVSLIVAGLVVIVIAEEIVWRGFVPALLADTIGSRRAWVWSAVLYAVAHLPTAWALRDPVAGPNPVVPLAALVTGLVWGAMARRFGRLLPGAISHVLFDWVVLTMFPLWGPGV